VRGELERYALAYKAYNTVSDSYKFTDAELETYYQQNKDSLDLFDYDYYLVQADKVDHRLRHGCFRHGRFRHQHLRHGYRGLQRRHQGDHGRRQDQGRQAIAASIKSGKDFDTAAAAVVDGAAATVQSGTAGSGVTDVYADWLKDSSRKAGDVTVVESSDTGYFVVEFRPQRQPL
jgi:hypothetical protein